MQGTKKRFELLQIFPFTSDRKRMSIIVRDGEYIKMYTKGADSIIKQRLAHNQILNLDDQLTRFSNIGLRTLLIAMRIISAQQYNDYLKKSQNIGNDKERNIGNDKERKIGNDKERENEVRKLGDEL